MKKALTATAIIGILTFAGIQFASAHGGGRYYGNTPGGYGYCGNYDADSRSFSKEDLIALEKFQEETSTIRKEVVVKRSELNALLRKDNPDENKVARLTGELYDLENELDKKAEAAGIDERFASRHGQGMMRGYGWGRGYHMMGW